MSKGSSILVVAIVLCVVAASLLVAARLGVLTDKGGNFVVATLGFTLAVFSRPISAWSHSVGERHLFLSHWQQVRPVWFLVAGVILAMVGLLSAFT
jgi:hypothetical protein